MPPVSVMNMDIRKLTVLRCALAEQMPSDTVIGPRGPGHRPTLGEDRSCASGDIRADRQTHTDRDVLFTILRSLYRDGVTTD